MPFGYCTLRLSDHAGSLVDRPGYGKSDDKNDFPSQLNTCIVDNQSVRLHALIQQQPGAWSAITAEELCKLLLQALNKSRSSMVVELIKKSAPGKAAAIPIAMQLELVEAPRWTHNEKAEMSELLDALLPNADFPMQHFKQLYAKACKEGKRELMLALSEYEKNFVKMREKGELPIYDAAAAGDPAKLLKELDARLGIPPLDNRLSGIGWFFNALHRWVAERFTAGAARKLINQPVGNVPLLHAAVASGNTETVRLLVERGADLSSLDRHGHTPLSKAKAEEQKNSEMVKLLIERHAPDRRPGSGSVAAPTQAASSRRKVTGQVLPHQDDMTDRPGYEETVKSFRNLLPEVVSVLNGFRDLARELNGGELMSAEQAGLFTASYLAEFEPPQAGDEQKSGRAPVLQTNLVVSRLHANRDKFRAEGLRLEASKARDIHGVLDNLASTTFADLWIDPRILSNLFEMPPCATRS